MTLVPLPGPLDLPDHAHPEAHLTHHDLLAGPSERLRAQTLAVLEEDRRFLVLATGSGLTAAPSRAVSAAGHTYLTSTPEDGPHRAALPKWAAYGLPLAALWMLGGGALIWAGIWGLAGLLVLGLWLVCRRPAGSGKGTQGNGGGWFDFGSGDFTDAPCGSDDVGSSSGCDSGAGS